MKTLLVALTLISCTVPYVKVRKQGGLQIHFHYNMRHVGKAPLDCVNTRGNVVRVYALSGRSVACRCVEKAVH
uniref:Putative secreted protein n=1 Tax=Anopheles marajoara TaxID=58244 RepID=A0A2M4CDN7_9DIPT